MVSISSGSLFVIISLLVLDVLFLSSVGNCLITILSSLIKCFPLFTHPLNYISMVQLWSFLLKSLSSCLLIAEESTHWLLRCILILLSPLLLFAGILLDRSSYLNFLLGNFSLFLLFLILGLSFSLDTFGC